MPFFLDVIFFWCVSLFFFFFLFSPKNVTQAQTTVPELSTDGAVGMILLPTQQPSFLVRLSCLDSFPKEWPSRFAWRMEPGFVILSPTKPGPTTRLVLTKMTCLFDKRSITCILVDTPFQSLPSLYLLLSSSPSRKLMTTWCISMKQMKDT